MPKISILIFLLELILSIDVKMDLIGLITPQLQDSDFNKISINSTIYLLLLSSLFSLIIGAVVGLSQTRIKRLLAYSTINHVGFLLLSLAVFSNFSLESYIFYIIQYSITNLNIFLILLALGYFYNYNYMFNYNYDAGQYSTQPLKKDLNLQNMKYLNLNETDIQRNVLINSDIENIDSLKGYFYNYPILSISFAISLFSFAGILECLQNLRYNIFIIFLKKILHYMLGSLYFRWDYPYLSLL